MLYLYQQQRQESKITLIKPHPDLDNLENRLAEKLEKMQESKRYEEKYRHFHYLLKKHAKSRKHITMINMRRLTVALLLIAGDLYVQCNNRSTVTEV